jgi:site-specific recombinase XerD
VEVRLEDLQPPLLLEFLAWLEAPMGRGVSPETRNCRLAALRSLSRFLELHRGKEEGTQWRRLRQLPFKLTTRSAVDYLEPREVDRVLSEVPAHTRDGFRDLTILALLYNTGARAEEVASLRRSALMLEEPPAVRLTGKGRCERTCPLWTSTAALLRRYLQQYRRRGRAAHERFVFVNQRGERLTRFGIGRIVEKYLRKAALTTPSLRAKRLSTHSFRHSTAIALLEGGADINVIKAWLGHRSTRTTSRYLDMSL